MQIVRLLVYEFPSEEIAVHQLNNRGVKGTQVWANCSISEQFYWTEADVCRVLRQVTTPMVEGKVPDGSK